jgi:hypothetical protein
MPFSAIFLKAFWILRCAQYDKSHKEQKYLKINN